MMLQHKVKNRSEGSEVGNGIEGKPKSIVKKSESGMRRLRET